MAVDRTEVEISINRLSPFVCLRYGSAALRSTINETIEIAMGRLGRLIFPLVVVLGLSSSPMRAEALVCEAIQEGYCGITANGVCTLDRGNILLHLNFDQKSGLSCRGERCDPGVIISSTINIKEKKYRWFSIKGKDFTPIYGFIDLTTDNNTFFAQSQLGLMFGRCN